MKKKVVAFVPIKLKSERLENKNILPLMKKPLCWHIFDKLNSCTHIDETYVYCSDENIKKYIPGHVKFLKRDSKLDDNYVKGYQIYESFIKEIDADIYILAHTTSPFLKAKSVQLALEKVLFLDYDSAFSAKKIQTFAWYNNKPMNYDLINVPRTQDIEPIFIETSGFYIFEKNVFRNYNRRIGFNPYIQEVDAIESIDIDTKEDYNFALTISNNKKGV